MPPAPPPPQVGDGVTEFTPTPSESRALIYEAYSVPRSLLVRFEEDTIDETPEMKSLLLDAATTSSSEAEGDDDDVTDPEVSSNLRGGDPGADLRGDLSYYAFSEYGVVSGSSGGSISSWGSMSSGAMSSSDGDYPPAAGGSSGYGSPAVMSSYDGSDPRSGSSSPRTGSSSPRSGSPRRRRRGLAISEVREIVLPGTHITPCGSDVSFEELPLLGAAEGALRRAKAEGQADVRRLVRQVAEWVGTAADEERRAAAAARAQWEGRSADSTAAGTPVAMTPVETEEDEEEVVVVKRVLEPVSVNQG